MNSSCRSASTNLVEDQQAPQSAQGEAKLITLCGSTTFETEFAEEITYAESLGKPVRYLSRERSARTGDGPYR